MSVTDVTIPVPQTIEEAIVLPLIASTVTTKERISDNLLELQRQNETTMRLIAELQAENESIKAELEEGERAEKVLLSDQDQEVRVLNEKVAAVAAEIAPLRVSATEADKSVEQAQNTLRPLLAEEQFLVGTMEGWRLRLEPLNQRFPKRENPWAICWPLQNAIQGVLSRNAQTPPRQNTQAWRK